MIASSFLSNWDVTLELAFTLIHPKPAEETPPPTHMSNRHPQTRRRKVNILCVGMGGGSTFGLIANHLYSVSHPPYIEEAVDNMFMD